MRVRVTETNVKDAKRRGVGPVDLVDSITSLTDDDRRFLTAWFRLFPVAPEVLDIAEMLCKQGSAASAELDELFSMRQRSTPRPATRTNLIQIPVLRANATRQLNQRISGSGNDRVTSGGVCAIMALIGKRHSRETREIGPLAEIFFFAPRPVSGR